LLSLAGGAAKWLIRKERLVNYWPWYKTTEDDSYVLIGQTNKHTAGVRWPDGWFLDPSSGLLASGDQPCVYNLSKDKTSNSRWSQDSKFMFEDLASRAILQMWTKTFQKCLKKQ
jgi:hypothetical protein